jgi:drug/metabolite transporter (DMT)-like permease
MKIGVKYAAPFEFVALRSLLGTLSLFLVLFWLRKPIRPKELLGTFLLGSLQTAGLLGFATWALVSGGAGKPSVLVYTTPFWVLFFAWPLLGERIRGWQWIAIILGLSGLLLILGPLKLNSGLVSDGLAILAGISWALSTIVAKKLRSNAEVDLLSLTTWQMLFGTIPLVAIALLAKPTPIVWSGQFIGALIYTGIGATALVWPLWLYLLNRLSAGAASMATLATPVVGVLAAWFQLGERPGLAELIGMLLIIIALFLISLQSLQQRR